MDSESASSRMIESSGLPLRARNALLRRNIYSIDELSAMPRHELLSIDGIGKKCLADIDRYLHQNGFGFPGSDDVNPRLRPGTARPDPGDDTGEPGATIAQSRRQPSSSQGAIDMRATRRLPARIMGIAAILVLGMLPTMTSGQTGAVVLSPKAGEIYYAGYVGDSIAPWDSIIVEWTYQDTSIPKITSPVIELSPDQGRQWATFRKTKGNMTKITSTKYRCRIDTTGYDISQANPPTLNLISETCLVRVYEYNDHSLGAVSGLIHVRLGPPPGQAVRGGIEYANDARPAAVFSRDGSAGAALSVLSPGQFRAQMLTPAGRAFVNCQGLGGGRYHLRAPAGVLLFRVRAADVSSTAGLTTVY